MAADELQSFYMTNLFGVISSDPDILLTHPNPIGDNDFYLKDIAGKVDRIVFAWGSFKQAYKSGRASEVMRMFKHLDRYCIRRSKLGRPWHPLFCFDNEQFIKF